MLPIINGVVEVARGSVARVVIVEVTSAAVIVEFTYELDVIIALDSVATGSVVVLYISVDDMGKVFMEMDISVDDMGKVCMEVDISVDDMGMVFMEVDISVDDMGKVSMEVDTSVVSTNKNHHAVIVLYIQLI